ncbi:MAG: hypothetical protein HZA52_13660 [Planctomycetes bacterium]|nr:hypothetical protein [Planctomycetota bacterium]
MRLDILIPLLALPVLPFVWPKPRPIEPLAPERELATLSPTDCTVYVETPGLADLARRGLEHPLARAVLAEPRVRALLAAGKTDPEGLLAGLDAVAGFEVLPTVAKLSERGAALSLAFRRAKPSALLVLRGADAKAFGEEVEELLALAAERAGHAGAFDQPMERVLGADVWRIGEELSIARRDALAFVSNDEAFLRDALALAASADAKGLAGTEDFAAAAKSRAPNELVFAFADLGEVDRRAEQGQLGDPEGWKKLRNMAREPGVQFLLGPTFAALGGARSASLSIACEREDVRLSLVGHGVDCGAAVALLPEAGAAFPPAPNGRANVATWVLHRDLADLFAKRADLFEPEQLPAFSEALSNLAIFFGGVDISETVIPALAPWGRVVVRDIGFDAASKPELAFPAAALIVRVEDPTQVGPLFPSAFQTVVGLMNVERGQQGKSPMQLQIELVGDVQVSYAKLMAPKPGEGVDVVYNLEPACALRGEIFVIGTHRKLVEELVRELAAGELDARAPTAETLEIAGDAVLAALIANREALVMNAVLSEGKTREKAERDLDGALAVAELLEHVKLEARRLDAGSFALELALDVAAPKE